MEPEGVANHTETELKSYEEKNALNVSADSPVPSGSLDHVLDSDQGVVVTNHYSCEKYIGSDAEELYVVSL